MPNEKPSGLEEKECENACSRRPCAWWRGTERP